MGDQTAKLVVRVFDGSRQAIGLNVKFAITIDDGDIHPKRVEDGLSRSGSVHEFDVDFFNSPTDIYSVNITAHGYQDTGCRVKVSNTHPTNADVMLLPSKATFKFPNGDWPSIQKSQPELYKLLRHGAADDQEAEARYDDLMNNHTPVLAAVMNITKAMSQIDLANGTALDYFKELKWDASMQQDRFYAWARETLLADVEEAARANRFAEEPKPWISHPGATKSYKQTEFGEGDVQLTFHGNEPARSIDGERCILVEPDIDYYRDLVAHGLLEWLPNTVKALLKLDASKRLTDPKQVYVLRWIAGQQADRPFEPVYVISA